MSRRRPSRWHGLLPVHKMAGPTSHDVVDMARRALRERRIGHTGTLDPMAEGLLLLCVGQATRLQQFLLQWDKCYLGDVRLGNATTTYDREGEKMEPIGPVPAIEPADLAEIRSLFTGVIDQLPPPYSAKKVDGKKLYEMARHGETVTVTPKQVHVHELTVDLVEAELLTVEVTTSSGFYVRSLAHDIGHHLGCGGHLAGLKRLRIGPYTTSDCLAQGDLEAATAPENVLEHPAWIPLEEIRLPFPTVKLNPSAVHRFAHGQEVVMFRGGTDEELQVGGHLAVRSNSDVLLGVGTVSSVLARGRTVGVRPAMVLANTQGA